MDKEDIINYVMETPGNSNPAVLGSMLESYGGGGSGGGSSGGVLYVTVTDTTTDEFSFTVDKTYEEMVSMIQANGIVIFTMEDIFGIANIVGEDISCTLTRFQGETMYVFSIYVSSDSAHGFEDIYALTPST